MSRNATPPAYAVSPAVGEFAITNILPTLNERVADLERQLAEAAAANVLLRREIADIDEALR